MYQSPDHVNMSCQQNTTDLMKDLETGRLFWVIQVSSISRLEGYSLRS